MKTVLIVAGVIVIAAIAGILYSSWKRQQAYSSIYYVNNYGRGTGLAHAVL